MLQQQVTAIADTQHTSDDKYSRAKQDNAALTARQVFGSLTNQSSIDVENI